MRLLKVKNGKWNIWNDDGTKAEEQYYKDGKRMEHECLFSNDGKVKQIITYVDGNVQNLFT